MRLIFFLVVFFIMTITGVAQYQLPDSTALEDIIVEVYYVSDTLDATDEDGGMLDTCSVTYRVYVDMKPGYELQAVFGNPNNTLSIETSTIFFNNEDRGEESGDLIGDNYLGDNTVALDSWVTMGGATESHWGILKSIDPDGSLIGGSNSDGGSEDIAGGILVNEDFYMGLPIHTADGLLEGDIPEVTAVGINLGVFADENDGPSFTTNSGAWSVLEGVQGPTDENQVLIAQITTQGEFSFRFNIQIGIPEELQCNHPDCHSTIQYVAELHPDDATPGVDNDNIFFRPELNYTSEPVICYPSVGVEEVNLETQLQVFPNPSNGHVQVQLNGQDRMETIRLLDLLGNRVAEFPLQQIDGTVDLHLDYPTGYYILQVHTTNGRVANKPLVLKK